MLQQSKLLQNVTHHKDIIIQKDFHMATMVEKLRRKKLFEQLVVTHTF